MNHAPVAVDDVGVEFVTSEDVAFTTADVTANDSDVDDPVVPSSVTVVSSVTHGGLVNRGDGTFTYTPDPEFFGVDSFTYTITDSAGAVSAPATVTIVVVVVNDPPVAAGDGGVGFVTSEDVAFTTGDVTANDSDVDHAVVPSSVAVVTSVTDRRPGRIRVTARSRYTPDPDFSGSDSVHVHDHRSGRSGLGAGDGHPDRVGGQRCTGGGRRWRGGVRDVGGCRRSRRRT